jgi:DASH complex subunit DAD4
VKLTGSAQESPHEHQQSQLLSRIIVNVVSHNKDQDHSGHELTRTQEKLNEALMMLNRNLQDINMQNMDTELVAQMFKNYQSNVLFHLEGESGNGLSL